MGCTSGKTNLVWFQTTKGHFGRKDLFKITLENLKKNIDLSFFDYKFLSLKQFNGDDDESANIQSYFDGFFKFIYLNKDPRINDESPFKDYGYYLLTNYLHDIASTYLNIAKTDYGEFTYLVEDDSPEIINPQTKLSSLIDAAKLELNNDKNLFSVHFSRESEKIRFSDFNLDFNSQDDYNFQNQLFRTKDMINVAEVIRANYENLMLVHTERSVRDSILFMNKNAKFKHFNVNCGYSTHIGVSNHQDVVGRFFS